MVINHAPSALSCLAHVYCYKCLSPKIVLSGPDTLDTKVMPCSEQSSGQQEIQGVSGMHFLSVLECACHEASELRTASNAGISGHIDRSDFSSGSADTVASVTK